MIRALEHSLSCRVIEDLYNAIMHGYVSPLEWNWETEITKDLSFASESHYQLTNATQSH